MRRPSDSVIACLSMCTGVLLSGLAGCGERLPYEIAPVSGKVTLNGQPLANATVSFSPDSQAKEVGPSSNGLTDAEGNYTLTTTDDQQGAVVGPHRVGIGTFKMKPKPPEEDVDFNKMTAADVEVQEKVPAKYGPRGKEALKFTVPDGGTSSANFELTGDPPSEFKGVPKYPPRGMFDQ